MRITKVRLSEKMPMSRGASSWPVPFCDFLVDSNNGKNGYLVKDISGLEAPNVTAQADGFDFNGVPIMRPVGEKRVITFVVELVSTVTESPSDLREAIYKLHGRLLNVSLMLDSEIVCQVSGWISRIEPELFSSRSMLAITVQCTASDFKSPVKTNIPISTLGTTTPTIMYEEGQAPTGLDLQFTCSTAPSSFSITNYNKQWFSEAESMGSASLYTVSGGIASLNPINPDNRFIVSYAFQIGDIVLLSTHPDDRRVVRFRSGAYLDLGGYVNAGAPWPVLLPGVNVLDWTLGTGVVINTATYTPRFWGV